MKYILLSLLAFPSVVFGSPSLDAPAGAVSLGVLPLHECGGYLEGYDTDGSPDNGPEVVLVVRGGGEGRPPVVMARVTYGPGARAKWVKSEVRVGDTIQVFTVFEAWLEAYPHPCALLIPGPIA